MDAAITKSRRRVFICFLAELTGHKDCHCSLDLTLFSVGSIANQRTAEDSSIGS
jgi:hypothetical protein